MAVNLDALKRTLSARRDWIVLVILIGGLVFVTLRIQDIIQGRISSTETTRPPRPPVTETSMPKAVEAALVNMDMAEWKSTVGVNNPFLSIAKQEQLRGSIRQEYQRGMTALESRQFDAAIASFEKVLNIDPFETFTRLYDEQGYPKARLEEARSAKGVSVIEDALRDCSSLMEQAAPKYAEGDKRGARDDYQRVVELATDALKDRPATGMDQQVERLRQILAEAQRRMNEIDRETFSDDIAQNLTVARNAYRDFNALNAEEASTAEGLSGLATSLAQLTEADERIKASPELAEDVPQPTRDEVVSLLEQIARDFEERLPSLKLRARDLSDQGYQNQDSATLAQARDICRRILEMKLDRDVVQQLAEIENRIKEVDLLQDEKRMKELVLRARDDLQTIESERKKSPTDWDHVETLKKDGLTSVSEAEQIFAKHRLQPSIRTLKEDLDKVKQQLAGINIEQSIANGRYIRNRGRRTFTVVIPFFGDNEITLTRTNPSNVVHQRQTYRVRLDWVSPDGKQIRVSVPGTFRETLMDCEECE